MLVCVRSATTAATLMEVPPCTSVSVELTALSKIWLLVVWAVTLTAAPVREPERFTSESWLPTTTTAAPATFSLEPGAAGGLGAGDAPGFSCALDRYLPSMSYTTGKMPSLMRPGPGSTASGSGVETDTVATWVSVPVWLSIRMLAPMAFSALTLTDCTAPASAEPAIETLACVNGMASATAMPALAPGSALASTLVP